MRDGIEVRKRQTTLVMPFLLHAGGTVKLTQGDLMGMPWRRAYLLASMLQEFGGNVEDKSDA